MTPGWILNEAAKADGSRGVVVLRDPERDRLLDRTLRELVWPAAKAELEAAGLPYMPRDEPLIEPTDSLEISRQLTFTQFKECGRLALARCVVDLRMTGWMVTSTFFLGLDRDQDVDVLFQIMGNSRFVGYPPMLTVSREEDRHDGFFQLTFNNGTGSKGGPMDHRPILDRLRMAIRTNTRLRELTAHGSIGREEFAEFVSTAYTLYEAY